MSNYTYAISASITILFALFSAPVMANSGANSISVKEAYVRIVPPGMNLSSAYMTLRNSDNKSHQLVKMESSAAQAVELHSHTYENNIMQMRPVKKIPIKAKGETALQPGGFHVMLIGLKHDLTEGKKIPFTLIFEDGSRKKIEAPVRKIQAEQSTAQLQDRPSQGHTTSH